MENWIKEMITDCKKAMIRTTQTDYWFGRLTAFEEVLKKIKKTK